MEQAGRRRVERCFDVRRMTAAYEAMYLGLEEPIGRFRAVRIPTAGVGAI